MTRAPFPSAPATGNARPRRAALAVAAAFILALTGCSPTAAPGSTDDTASETVTVYAAASLGVAFIDLAALFEEQNPGITVATNFDGSATLATQIEQGAPADVFATADTATLDTLAADGLIDNPTLFAANTLVIAVAPGNPLGITGLSDLARTDVTTVLCAAGVPCGAASATLLDRAGVTLTPASEEQNVTAVVTKVASGEADAGLVYATDLAANPDRLDGVTPEGASDVVSHYPIGVVSDTAQPGAAQAFVDLVLSDAGQAVLARHGFLAP